MRELCGNPKAALRDWRNNSGTCTLLEIAFPSYVLQKLSRIMGK